MNTVQRYRKADWSKVWHFRQFHGNFANITYFENMESLNSRWFCLGKRFQTFFGGMDVVALRWYSPAWRWKVHLDAMQFFVGVLWQNAPSVAGGTVGRQVARQSRPRVAAARQHTHVGPLLVPGMCAPTETSLLVPGANAEPLSRLKERAPFTVCFPATTSLSHNVYNIQLLVLRSLRSALQSSINVPFFEAMFQSLVRCLTGLRLSEFFFRYLSQLSSPELS